MKGLKIFGIVLLVLVVIVVLVGGYFGFIPGVSSLFGSNKPKDLGVTYTEQDRQSALTKVGWEVIELPPDLPPEESLIYSGQNTINTTFNKRELTAGINPGINPNTWMYHPVSDCQIRINDDGTVEFSGKLDIGKLQVYIDVMGASDEAADVMDIFQKWFIFGNPAVYLKTSGAVYNGEATNARVHAAEIGKFSVPTSILEDLDFGAFVEWQIDAIPGLSVEILEFSDGEMRFVGMVPATISEATK